jgi:adenylate kinase
MKVNLSLIGRPGSGKGTYGKALSNALNCPLVVMGDVLREHVRQGSNIGKKVDCYQREGKLVDDLLVSQALLEHLKHLNNGREETRKNRFGFILDGFPRTLTQAKMLLQRNYDNDETAPSGNNHHQDENDLIGLSWPKHLKISFAVNINVPEIICIGKMKGRRTCLKCNEAFNVTNIDTDDGFFMPPKLPTPYPCNKCDMESDWSQRLDDTSEIFQRRMREYDDQSSIVTEYFSSHDKLAEFVPYRGIDDMHILEKAVNHQANCIDFATK